MYFSGSDKYRREQLNVEFFSSKKEYWPNSFQQKYEKLVFFYTSFYDYHQAPFSISKRSRRYKGLTAYREFELKIT